MFEDICSLYGYFMVFILKSFIEMVFKNVVGYVMNFLENYVRVCRKKNEYIIVKLN